MKPPRTPTPEELQAWVAETARDTLHKLPPEIPAHAPSKTLAPKPAIAAPTPVKKPKAPARLLIGETKQLDGNLARRFVQGKIPLDGVLDLHGMHKMKALEATQQFLLAHAERGNRHLLIITGKGSVLRAAIEEWLNLPALRPHVLAASYGREERGGEGALYLLLKRIRARHVTAKRRD